MNCSEVANMSYFVEDQFRLLFEQMKSREKLEFISFS